MLAGRNWFLVLSSFNLCPSCLPSLALLQHHKEAKWQRLPNELAACSPLEALPRGRAVVLRAMG